MFFYLDSKITLAGKFKSKYFYDNSPKIWTHFPLPNNNVLCIKYSHFTLLCEWQLSHVWLSAMAIDCGLPGSSAHGILQAKILKWLAISFSRVFSPHRDWIHLSYISYIGRQIILNILH